MPAVATLHLRSLLFAFEQLESRCLLSGLSEMTPFEPYGSLAYRSEASGEFLTENEIDVFQIELQAGSILNFALNSNETLQTMVNVRSPGGSVVATGQAATSGEAFLLADIPIDISGQYDIEIGNAASTVGAYSIEALLNASHESESFGGSSNDTLLSAQELESTFVDLLSEGTSQRGAVVGTLGSNLIALEDFETAPLGPQWQHTITNEFFLDFNSSTASPGGGNQSLQLRAPHHGLSEIDFSVDLTGVDSAELRFWTQHHEELIESFPTSFTGSVNADGVAISEDGITWYPVYSPPGYHTNWAEVRINLSEAATAAGIALGPDLKIRFQLFNDSNNDPVMLLDQIAISSADFDDVYAMSLSPGESANVVLTSLTGEPISLDWLDSNGEVVALVASADSGTSQFVPEFISLDGGTYFAHVCGFPDTQYSLVVTRGAAMDIEPNDWTLDDAQPLNEVGVVLGALESSGMGRLFGLANDIIEIDPLTGDVINSGPSPVNTSNAIMGIGTTPDSVLVGSAPGPIFELDPDSLEVIRQFGDLADPIGGIAFLNGEVFVMSNLPRGQITVLDYDTGVVKRVLQTSPEDQFAGGVLATDNQLIAAPVGSGVYSINPNTGETQLIPTYDIGQGYDGIARIGDELFVKNNSYINVYDFETGVARRSISFVESYGFRGLGGDLGGPDDFYRIEVDAGTLIQASTRTPLDAGANPLNGLDPFLSLYDPTGAKVTVNDDGAADGRNASLDHTATLDGVYTVRVSAEHFTIGEYVLVMDTAVADASHLPPFSAVEPYGSLIRETAVSDSIAFVGDADRYTADFEAGQTLAVQVDPEASLRVYVKLFAPDGSELAHVSSSEQGALTLLQAHPLAVSGAYTVELGGLESAMGAYDAEFLLNTWVEQEAIDGTGNNDTPNAQNLTNDLISLSGLMSRVAVMGNGIGDQWNEEQVQVPSSSTGPVTFEFATPLSTNEGRFVVKAQAGFDVNPSFLTIDFEGLHSVVLFEEGSSSTNLSIGEIVLERALFEALTADGMITVTATPTLRTDNFSVLFLELSFPETGDLYQLDLNAGDVVDLALSAHKHDGGTLLELLDSTDNVLALGSFDAEQVARGINGFVAAQTGTYFVRVTGDSEYVLTTTVNGGFERERHGVDGPQVIGPTGRVLGSLGQEIERLFVHDPNNAKLQMIHAVTGDILNSFEGIRNRGRNEFGLAFTGHSLLAGGTKFLPILELDPTTGHVIRTIENPGFAIDGIAFADNRIYMNVFSGTSAPHQLLTLDYETGNVIQLQDMDADVLSLTATPSGLVGVIGSLVYDVDPATGLTTPRGSLTPPSGSSGLTFIDGLIAVGSGSVIRLHDSESLILQRGIGLPSGNTIAAMASAGEVMLDRYSFNATAGDQLTIRTATPFDGPQTTRNSLDPTLELIDPFGEVIAFDDNSDIDGRNAFLNFDVAVTGTYTVRVAASDGERGEYVLTVEGNSAVPPFEVAQVFPTDGHHQRGPVDAITLSFSEEVLLTSLEASDLTINGIGAIDVDLIDGNTLRFLFPELSTDGTYTIEMEAGGLTSVAGRALVGFASEFVIDNTPPKVVGSSINAGDIISTGTLVFVAEFDEAIRQDLLNVPGVLDQSDAFLIGQRTGPVTPTSIVFDDATLQLTVVFDDVQEDDFILTLRSGPSHIQNLVFLDLDGESTQFPLPPNVSGDGQPGGDFVVSFSTDRPTSPAPISLYAIAPSGGLIYKNVFYDGLLTPGDIFDRRTIELDAGQKLTVRIEPLDAELQLVVRVLDSSGAILGEALAPAMDQPALLQGIDTTSAGEFTIEVADINGAVGVYGTNFWLNATLEIEPTGGATNDQISDAELLSFINVTPVAPSFERAAVLGETEGGINFVQSVTAEGILFSPNVIELEFGDLTLPLNDGELIVEVRADLGLPDKYITVDLEGIVVRDLFIEDGSNGGLETATIALTRSEILALMDDGVINATVTPSSTVNQKSTSDVILTLQYPQSEGNGDIYRFDATAGQTIELVAASRSDALVHVKLLDDTGALLARGAVANTSSQSVLRDFVVQQDSTFYAVVTGASESEYSLLVTREGAFDPRLGHAVFDTRSITPIDLTRTGNAYASINNVAEKNDYVLQLEVGDVIDLETQTFASDSGGFGNAFDPLLQLLDSSGLVLLASDDNSALDGRNASLQYSVTETDTYVVRVIPSPLSSSMGEYSLTVRGTTSEPPSFEVLRSEPGANAFLIAAPQRYLLHFNRPLMVSSVDATDLLIDGLSAMDVTLIDGDTLAFDLPVTLGEGIHQVAMSQGALTDVIGAPLLAFNDVFTIDSTPPRVVSSSLQDGDVINSGNLPYTAVFNDILQHVEPWDVLIHSSSGVEIAPSAIRFDDSTQMLSADFVHLQEGDYTLTLRSGDQRLEDRAGNDLDGEAVGFPLPPLQSGDGVAGGDFVVNFSVETTTAPLPAELSPVLPLASLAHRGIVRGQIDDADVDRYTLELEAGQSIAVLVEPEGDLQPMVTLLGPSGTLGSSSSAADEDALLQQVAVNSDGTYSIKIAGLAGTSGGYKLTVLINGSFEIENQGGASNDDTASAEDLNSRFVPLDAGISQAVAIGGSTSVTQYESSMTELDTLFGPNVLTFSFDSMPDPLESVIVTFEAVGDLGSSNEYINVSLEGIVTKRIFQLGGLDYSPITDQITLSIEEFAQLTQDGVIDVTVTPRFTVEDFGDESMAVTISYPTLEPVDDVFAFDLTAGESAQLSVRGAEGESVFVSLLDSAGNTLSIGSDQPLSLDQAIADFVAPTSGTYYARIEGQLLGDYALIVTKGGSLESEPEIPENATPRDITRMGGVVGYLSGLATFDDYAVAAEVGDVLEIKTFTPFDRVGDLLNGLDPILELYDPTGNQVTLDDNSATDGRNASIMHTATMIGQYRIRVRHNPMLPSSGLGGEYYALESDGNIGELPDFDSLTPDLVRVDEQIAFPSMPGDFANVPGLANKLAVRWTGAIYIEKPGEIEFSLTSDDGSRLYIDNQLIIDHGGLHGMTEREGTVTLSAGLHRLQVDYFENLSSGGVELRYKPVDGQKQLVPPQVFFQSTESAGPIHGDYVLEVSGHTGAIEPQINSTALSDGMFFANPPEQLLIDFHWNFQPGSIEAADLRINGVAATAVTLVDGDSALFTISVPAAEGDYFVEISEGAISTHDGSPFGALQRQFTVDFTSPQFDAMDINLGESQRSALNLIVIGFNETVDVDPMMLSLVNTTTGVMVDPADMSIQFDETEHLALISFSGSLSDGIYQVTLEAEGVRDLAGNTLDTNIHVELHQQFGDSNGNRRVDISDLFRFRNAYLSDEADPNYVPWLDQNGNGSVDIPDLFRFRSVYLTTLPESDVAGDEFVDALDLGLLIAAEVTGYVDNIDDRDYFRFDLGESALVTAHLTSLTSNIDLHLFDQDFNLIANSMLGGSDDESIVQVLLSGTYFLLADNVDVIGTSYQLHLHK